jgi:hypothetical protein
MEQLRKETYARNTPITVPSKAIDINHEHEMVVEWNFNCTLLQDKLMLCKRIKHISSFAVIFFMLSLLMFSTWMVVALVKCEQVQVDNNMLSVDNNMQQVHKTEFKDKGQVG